MPRGNRVRRVTEQRISIYECTIVSDNKRRHVSRRIA